MKPKKLQKSEYGPKTAEFLDLAYKDYLAARVLLNAHLVVQGAVLASTAIEKYFKAILAFRGNESHGHLKKAHFNAAKNFDMRLAAVLNDDFLLLLQKSYSLRYLDDLPNGFNLVIASREFLAELDQTAITMQESFRLSKGGKNIVLRYHTDKANRDPHLYHDNFLLNGLDKQSFISAEPQLVFEIRQVKSDDRFEVEYLARPTQSDGKFLRAGFMPLDEVGARFQMALKPLAPNDAS